MAGEIASGPRREQHHAAHRAVARDCEIRQQEVALGFARVLHGRYDADVELSPSHPSIELGWYTVNQLGVDTNDAAVDRAVYRIAVYVRNASDLHQAATAADEARSKTRKTL